MEDPHPRHGTHFAAEHPARPFHTWYHGDAARAHVGQVIVVGPACPQVPARLGWACAPDFESALDLARGHTGKAQPDLTLLRAPPFLVCDVAP